MCIELLIASGDVNIEAWQCIVVSDAGTASWLQEAQKDPWQSSQLHT